MKIILWVFMLTSFIIGTTAWIVNAQTAQTEDNSMNNLGNGMTGSVMNLTSASTSHEDAKNISANQATLNPNSISHKSKNHSAFLKLLLFRQRLKLVPPVNIIVSFYKSVKANF